MGILRNTYGEIKKKTSGKRTRSVLQFVFFVFVSTVLWTTLTLNKEGRYKIEIPVEVTDVPSDVRFLTQVPDTITIAVNCSGSSYFKYYMFSDLRLTLNFKDYSDDNGLFRLDNNQLEAVINRLLASKFTLISISPKVISATYTDHPGKLVPVILDVEVHPANDCAQTASISCVPDSVLIYGDSNTLDQITEVYSYHVSLDNLKDTLSRSVTLAPIKNVVIDPRTVNITVPVEHMATKSQKVPVKVCNVPANVKIIVFPSMVDVSFRVPLSLLRDRRDTEFYAVVDYNSINVEAPGNKVKLLEGEVPGAYKDVHFALDSVEYIIEK